MVVLTVLLSPALIVGAFSLFVAGAPSEPCRPDSSACGPAPYEFALFGLGLGAPAVIAIVVAWKRGRLSPRRRIETLVSAIVLDVIWVVSAVLFWPWSTTTP